MTTSAVLSARAPDLAAHLVSGGPPAPLVRAHDLHRVWGSGRAAQIGVAGVHLEIQRGELVAIVGPSGSGKSTLGAILAGIDRPTSGSLVVDGTRVDRLRPERLAGWRGANVGIVFQDFHLLPTLTARENVELALRLSGASGSRRSHRHRATAALERVGLADRSRHLPTQLSGGEQQRVGIARAMVTNPKILVADEPTGSLDQVNGQAAFELLTGLAAAGTTVVFITHDLTLAASADRVVTMSDGRIVSDATRRAG